MEFTFSENETGYIDLSQCASILNRRFYRQGLQWAVAGIKIQSNAPGVAGSVTVSKLPETWVVGAAWEKSMSKWMEQQDRALADMGATETKGRYNDYKIHMDDNHVTAGFPANKIPQDLIGGAFLTGEWEHSQVVIPNDGGVPGNTAEYAVKMIGNSNALAKGIIGGYVFSRSRPQSPDPATPAVNTSWFNELHDDGSTNNEIVINAVEINDELPYDAVVYPGQGANGQTTELVSRETFSATTVSSTNRISGFVAPCGLLKVVSTIGCIFTVYLVPGDHRGYMCEPMQEMN
jgi:hypothetical protein